MQALAPDFSGPWRYPDENVKADVIADEEPHFYRGNFCSVIRCSHWHG